MSVSGFFYYAKRGEKESRENRQASHPIIFGDEGLADELGTWWIEPKLSERGEQYLKVKLLVSLPNP